MIKNNNYYKDSINKVQDYIEDHLGDELTIEKLSSIASFSPYHFQRLYLSLTGETLYGYIKRIRLEKATYYLMMEKEKSIQDIALSIGFSNQASFAKAFKNKYGISSSEYRKKNDPILTNFKNKFTVDETLPEILPDNIKVRYEDEKNVVYLRHVGPYSSNGQLFNRLFTELYEWSNDRSLVNADSKWYVIYHDYGYETQEELLRLSVCLETNEVVSPSDGIGKMQIASGKYARGQFRVGVTEFGYAWRYMLAVWLPNSGYILDERPSFEYYTMSSKEEDKFVVEICLPIK